MIEEFIMNMIGSYAFPIVMCCWFMFRTEKIIKRNTDAFMRIGEVIDRCQKK